MAILFERIYDTWRKKTEEKAPYFIARLFATTTAAVTVVSSYIVPSDYDLILCHVLATFSGGGAQTANIMQLTASTQMGGSYLDWGRPAVPLVYDRLSMTGHMHLKSNTNISATGTFSAGALGNTVELSFLGYLIHPLAIDAI